MTPYSQLKLSKEAGAFGGGRVVRLVGGDFALEFVNRLITFFWIVTQRLHGDRGERIGNVPIGAMNERDGFSAFGWIVAGRRGWIAGLDFDEQFLLVTCGERRSKREDVVKDCAEVEDVSAFVHLLNTAFGLFGRHEIGRADHGAESCVRMFGWRFCRQVALRWVRFGIAQYFCKSPIEHQHFAKAADENVGRF